VDAACARFYFSTEGRDCLSLDCLTCLCGNFAGSIDGHDDDDDDDGDDDNDWFGRITMIRMLGLGRGGKVLKWIANYGS